jgi:hypothetical protein
MLRTLDPAFLNEVANTPAVRVHLGGDGPLDLAPLIEDRNNITLVCEHGGFIFRNADGFGFVRELHSMFLPEGWGRSVVEAAREATQYVFDHGCQVMFTHEQASHWRSRPPRSHGWKLASEDYRPTLVGHCRIWVLTPELWRNSAIFKD